MNDYSVQRVLLASSIRWPVAAKLALAFLRQGCEIEAVCPKDHPFAFVSGIGTIYPYSGLDSIQSLREAIALSGPDLVVPCDDGVVWQLHELQRTRPELRVLIERSLGAPSGYATVAGRGELMRLAQELHIRVPHTRSIEGASDLQDWFSEPGVSGVLKLDWTCGGKGVHVVNTLAEAEQALAAMHRPASLVTALGRWLLIHDSLALWKWKNHRKPVLTLQQFVEGRPANTLLACRDGKVLALVTVEVLFAQGPTGTALAVRLIEHDEIARAAERIAERLQLSGFHGLDFILEEGTGHAYLLELNPRCTQLGHLRLPGQGDLAGVLCRGIGGAVSPQDGSPEEQAAISRETIAFFPESLLSNPKCPYLETAYIDVPWEEPRLVRELMRRDWRDRQLLARVYRALRPARRRAVLFEGVTATPRMEVPAVVAQEHLN